LTKGWLSGGWKWLDGCTRWLCGGLRVAQWWSEDDSVAVRRWLYSNSAVADVVILCTKILIIKLPFAIV